MEHIRSEARNIAKCIHYTRDVTGVWICITNPYTAVCSNPGVLNDRIMDEMIIKPRTSRDPWDVIIGIQGDPSRIYLLKAHPGNISVLPGMIKPLQRGNIPAGGVNQFLGRQDCHVMLDVARDWVFMPSRGQAILYDWAERSILLYRLRFMNVGVNIDVQE